MNYLRSSLVLALSLLLPAPAAHAASAVSAGEEAASRIKTASAVGALGDDLFGEEIGLYSGSVEFRATDLSLPGDNGLSVALSRRFVVDTSRAKAEPGDDGMWLRFALGDWELDLPYMAGTYTQADGWTVGGGVAVGFPTPHQRCSSPQSRDQFGPRDHGTGTVRWLGGEFWGGVTFRSPDGGERPVLFRDVASTIPTPTGITPKLVTRDNWYFTCGVNLTPGQHGEGFIANGPDGTKIHFTHMVAHAERPMSKYWRDTYSYEELQAIRGDLGGNPQPPGNGELDPVRGPIYLKPDAGNDSTSNGGNTPVYMTLQRQYLRIYPSKIVDRFGNQVTYTWNGDRLVGIASSDGRAITLTYGDIGGRQQLVSASDGTSTVNYSYQNGALRSVVLPDGVSEWTYDASTLRAMQRYQTLPSLDGDDYDDDYACAASRKLTADVGVVSIGHPSGATGTFEFAFKRHLRSDIHPAVFCDKPIYIGDSWEAYIHFEAMKDISPIADQMTVPVVFDTLTLTAKSITGIGLPQNGYDWIYTYENLVTDVAGILSNGKRRVRVIEPQGQLELTFGAGFLINEGQLLESRRIENGKVLERTVNTYASAGDAATLGLPGMPGLPLTYDADVFGNLFRPQLVSELHRDGVVFRSETEAFDDSFALPTEFSRSSRSAAGALRDSVEEAVEYYHDLGMWVIGQTAKQWRDGKETSRTSYGTGTALPAQIWNFHGADGDITPESTLTYCLPEQSGCTPGQLKSSTDALGRTTLLSDWYRGIPRDVDFPDGTSLSATVSQQGRVLSVTDQRNRTTTYAYDAMGRVNLITPPPSGWASTEIVTAKSGGRWTQTTTKAGYTKVVQFDALLRPAHTAESGSGVDIEVARSFDHAGREIFVSYPGTTANTNSPGVRSTFDALGRPLTVRQISELGALESRYEYLDGFRTRAINPRGHSTTTSFQVFDQPDTSRPTLIVGPDGMKTTIARDGFGNATSISRPKSTAPGAPVLERQYVYDAAMRLCKRIEPESGAAIFAYDAVGSLAWSAEGTSLTGTSCDRGSVPLAARVLRGYDEMNRLESVTYPDVSQNLVFGYHADGQLQSASAGAVTSNYEYNTLGLLDQESLALDGSLYSLDYIYDASGALSGLTYPDNTTTAFAPDALGRPTRVGNYVTSVGYTPAGTVDNFTYGNGVEFVGELNARQLPWNATYTLEPADDFLYSQDTSYDRNGNVLAYLDLTLSARRDRVMQYDALDRLTRVDIGDDLGGPETFSYDLLDNLLSATRGSQSKTYSYDASNRLASMSRSGQSALTFGYDSRGRATARDGVAMTYDDGNRLTSVGAVASYAYDAHGLRARRVEGGATSHFMYSRAGQLVFEKNLTTSNETRYHYLGRRLVAKVSDSPLSPGVPQLQAPALSSGIYTISWTAVAGATKYRLQERVGQGGWTLVTEPAGLSHAFTAKPVGVYSYRVAACNANECGQYSSPAETTVIDAPVLSVPATSSNGSYTVSWTEVPGATNYTLEEQHDGGAWSSTGPNMSPSRSFSGKANGQWSYRVCARTGGSCGPWSAIASVQVGAVPEIWLEPEGDIRSSYVVKWSTIGTSVRYELQQDAGSGWTTPTSLTTTSLEVLANAAGSTHFRVRSCTASLCRPYSRAVTRVVKAAPTLTTPATSVQGTYEVSWTPVEGAVGYRLQSKFGAGSWQTLSETADIRHPVYRDAPGSYQYRVAACERDEGNALRDDCGVWSSATATVVAAGPSVNAPATNVSGNYTVSWSSVTGASAYAIDEDSGDGVWARIAYQPGTSLSVTNRQTATYRYRVAACVSAEDCGAVSAPATVVVTRPPAVPVIQPPGADVDGNFRVGWSQSIGATYYILKEQAGDDPEVEVYQGSATFAELTNRAPGSYRYWVKACNHSCSDFSEAVTGWVLPETPTLAGSNDNGTVLITISTEPGATYYVLKERAFVGWNIVNGENSDETTVELPGRAAGEYDYIAQACNGGGCSYWSSELTVVVTVVDIDIPTISVSPATSTDGSYDVSWTAVTGATSYQLQERLDDGDWQSVPAPVSSPRAFTGRAAGTYEYQVRACIDALCGGYSDPEAVQVASVPLVPELTAPAYSSDGDFDVQWTDSAGASRYELERRIGGGSWIERYVGTATAIAETGLAEASYSYLVRACNSHGCSPDSEVATTVVQETVVPVVNAPTSSATGDYTIAWTSVEGATYYRLEENSNGAGWMQVYANTGTSHSVSGRGLGEHVYRVRACASSDPGGCGAYSETDATFVDLAPYLTVGPLDAEDDFTVSWTAVPGATGYELQEKTDNGAWGTIQTGAGLSRTITGKGPGTHSYRVRACSGTGCGSYSTVGVVQIAPIVGIVVVNAPVSSSTGSYTVSWTSVDGATYYRLEENSNGAGWVQVYANTGTSHTVTGRGFGEHTYRARACASSAVESCGAYSETDATFVDLVPELTAGSPNTAGDFTVSWTAVSGATGYELQERTDNGAWGTIQTGAGLSRNITGKGAGTHSYRVRACGAAGCGSYSAEISRGLAPTAAPNLAGPLSNSTGSYLISWGSVAGATTYFLDERFNFEPYGNVYEGPGLSKSRSGRLTGSHRYVVRACNSHGCGPDSAVLTVEVELVPSGVPVISSPEISGNGSYTVDWTTVSGSTSYELQEQVGGGSWTGLQNTSASSRAISGKPNGTYGYRVRACNGGTCGGWSDVTTTQVILVPGGVPVVTAPASSSTGAYEISWTTVAGAVSYKLEETTTATWQTVQQSSATTRSFSGKAEDDYSYRVSACNAGGCGSPSAVKVVHVGLPVTGTPTLTLPSTNTTGIYNATWTVVTGATQYVLEERPSGGSWSSRYTGAATMANISSMPSGAYDYRIKACNAVGCGPVSAVSTIVVTLPAAVPAVPSSLEVMQTPMGKCRITWQTASGATSYEVRAYTTTVYTGSSATTLQNNNCAGEYSVRACNSSGCSAWSAGVAPSQE